MPTPYRDWRCSGCGEGHRPRDPIEERYSLGLYAGRYHARCWQRSGYRDDGPEGFDPLDAGETYEEDR